MRKMTINTKIAVAFFAVIVAVMIPMTSSAKKTFISIGTGGTGGVYYPYGAAMAKVLGDTLPNVEVTAESTGASVENFRLLSNDDIQIAMVFANVAFDASRGQGKFEKPIDFKVLMTMYPTPIHVIVPKKSSVESISDLKGMRIGVGSPGSGNEVISKLLLGTYGITYDDCTPEYLSIGEIMNGLKDGTLDAGISCTAYPTATIMDLAISKPVRLIPINAEEVKKIQEKSPFFFSTKIPDNVYKDVEGVETAGFGNLMVVRSDMPEQRAYDIVKALFEHKSDLEAAHRIAKQLTLETAVESAGLPRHDGATKYFKENGAIK
ncbi:MAG: TAXI family TRAP transporter solute-binding subunit [Deltaproteobacteria bacterium]|nr:TAXI family TRAP transporter solute-binding subunit [Deltaproteobacteria bacterium]